MAAINAVVDLATEDRIAVLTVNYPPVNALSADVRAGLDEGVKRAGADAGVDAIVLRCAGRTFIAGADITEFGKPPRDPSLPTLLDTIEASPKPIARGDLWDGAGRRVGDGAGVALACCVGGRQARPAGGEAGPSSRRRRHAAAAAPGGCRDGVGDDHLRCAGRRQGGAGRGADR